MIDMKICDKIVKIVKEDVANNTAGDPDMVTAWLVKKTIEAYYKVRYTEINPS